MERAPETTNQEERAEAFQQQLEAANEWVQAAQRELGEAFAGMNEVLSRMTVEGLVVVEQAEQKPFDPDDLPVTELI